VKSQKLAAGNETTFALVFDKDDEPVAGITALETELGAEDE
jgi:hypothetical protein